MSNPMTRREKRVMWVTLVVGALLACVVWIWRDELDPNWEQRLEGERRHMEEMDRLTRYR